AKGVTSCDNAFVTNIVLARDPGASLRVKRLIRRPPESAQSERKSTPGSGGNKQMEVSGILSED
ncbi:MAG: hypothetical protein RR651_03855, partial [Lysinibacillus sp.]